jgi:hypothetical protein
MKKKVLKRNLLIILRRKLKVGIKWLMAHTSIGEL